MPIDNTFRELFELVYNGNNAERDYIILLDYYFPPQPYSIGFTLQELANKYNLTRERIRQIKDDFENNIKDCDVLTEQNPSIRDDILAIGRTVEENGHYLSLDRLSCIYQSSRSYSGFVRLVPLLGLRDNHVQVIEVNGHGYIIPDDVERIQITKALGATKKLANHYGSVYPFSKLFSIPEWNFIPSLQRIRFIRELLQSEEKYIELGDGEFFGFLGFSRDRILSRLVQIFTVFEKVPIENLVKSLHRTIKKRVINDDQADLTTLGECSEVFDEFCILSGYCYEKDGCFLASEELKKYIGENPQPNDTMFVAEKKLVKRLQENGFPMFTSDFVRVVEETHANESHIMEYAGLLYRTGFRRNSVYHTLDDQYSYQDQKQVNQAVDRTRIEINKINRDSYLTKKVKRLCQNHCQICGSRLQIGDDEFYSEVHHVRPLGDPHNGPDIVGNMLCVCPNCHVLLDYGAVPLDISRIYFLENNQIGSEYIDYHNQKIFHS